MTARKRLHTIVIALCLWLPLQAIAGQWLHCAQLDSPLLQLDQPTVSIHPLSCHDTAAAPEQQVTDTAASSATDISSCKHCQFSCSWHSALLLREFAPPSIYFSLVYTQFTFLPPVQPALATPQRPPRLSV